MSKPTDKTSAQALFIRAFRENPAGPPPADWPNPGTFRRWLKKECFRNALSSIRDALRFQADIHVATAAANAAKSLQAALPAAGPLEPAAAAQLTTQLKAITDLLRLAHLRQRFSAESAPPDPSDAPQPGAVDLLNDPSRLKGFLIAQAYNCRDYDQFLAAFPEELEEARRATASPQVQTPA